LIADTLAFVKQIAGAQPDLAAQLRAAADAEVKAAENPKQILPPSDFKPGNLSNLRNEIRDRVETFRLRQQALQDEREASYREAVVRLRAELDKRN
jgi:hypothetical protein